MKNGDRCVGERRNSCQNGAASDVIDRNHVDGVVDIWYESELNASLDHPPNKIIGVGDWKDL